jgi:hypothetical protein
MQHIQSNHAENPTSFQYTPSRLPHSAKKPPTELHGTKKSSTFAKKKQKESCLSPEDAMSI